MGRWVTMLAVAAVVSGCGGSDKAATRQNVGGAAASAEIVPTPFPVIWSRSLPDTPALHVTALYVDSVSSDVIVGGTLRASAQMSDVSLVPSGGSDGIGARFDAADGTQKWVTQIESSDLATVQSIGSDRDGNMLLVSEFDGVLLELGAECVRDTAPFVAKLDRASGALLWVAGFGADAGEPLPNDSALSDAWEEHQTVEETVRDLGWDALSDGAFALADDEQTSLLVREPNLRKRWVRTDIAPEAVVELTRGILVSGTVDGTLATVLLDRADGSTIWHMPIDDELIAPRLSISLIGETIAAIEYDPIVVRVYTIDPGGDVLSVGEIGIRMLAPTGPDGVTYTVRARGNSNDLVKLGPCPVERCTMGAW